MGLALFEKWKNYIESKLNESCIGKSFSPDPDTITDILFKQFIMKSKTLVNCEDLWDVNKALTHYWLLLNTLQTGKYFGSDDYCMKTVHCQSDSSAVIIHALKIDYKTSKTDAFGKAKLRIDVKRLLPNGAIVDK